MNICIEKKSRATIHSQLIICTCHSSMSLHTRSMHIVQCPHSMLHREQICQCTTRKMYSTMQEPRIFCQAQLFYCFLIDQCYCGCFLFIFRVSNHSVINRIFIEVLQFTCSTLNGRCSVIYSITYYWHTY